MLHSALGSTLKSPVVRVDDVVVTVDQTKLDACNFAASHHALLAKRTEALLHGGHKVFRDVRSHSFVHELELRVFLWRQWLEREKKKSAFRYLSNRDKTEEGNTHRLKTQDLKTQKSWRVNRQHSCH